MSAKKYRNGNDNVRFPDLISITLSLSSALEKNRAICEYRHTRMVKLVASQVPRRNKRRSTY
jgi:hypothetical protein